MFVTLNHERVRAHALPPTSYRSCTVMVCALHVAGRTVRHRASSCAPALQQLLAVNAVSCVRGVWDAVQVIVPNPTGSRSARGARDANLQEIQRLLSCTKANWLVPGRSFIAKFPVWRTM